MGRSLLLPFCLPLILMLTAGGYETVAGQSVRTGVLYRSDSIAELNDGDLRVVSRLGLHTVFDLRHDGERAGAPPHAARRGDLGLEIIEMPIYFPQLDRTESRRKILSADVEEGHFRSLLIAANRSYALDFTDEWSALLHRLAEPSDIPAVVHCVEGKDRTGFAIALVLRAVGVPHETVMEDYLLSNQFLGSRSDYLSFLASMGSLFRVPRSEIRDLLDVRPEYLQAAFDAMDERYGSFDAYLRDGLGMDDETLARLRTALLE